MKSRTILLIAMLPIVILSYSCANLFNQAVMPNQCKKCDVVNKRTNDVLWSKEGCGGENTGLRAEAERKAYTLMHDSGQCDAEVRCKNWKKEIAG